YVGPVPLTAATRVPPTVLPAKLTSDPVKPVTDSLNTTVKLIGEALVGSAWPAAWLIVTIALIPSQATLVCLHVDAALLSPSASCAAQAGMDAPPVPSSPTRRSSDLYVGPVPLTAATRVPPTVLPAKLTSDPVKPVTDSLNTTVKLIGEALVRSGWAAA